ncbi:hypothetical protein THOM_0957 [Trachipleistophora hominis]|uniref:Uncharacterized protein n=1 Tax=Trachipleistophora hominis TaxID=72359 RepID=L7JX76_TRAHO|nr:hypothetical protein THOM_0957 [Trachipleistophora hominis]
MELMLRLLIVVLLVMHVQCGEVKSSDCDPSRVLLNINNASEVLNKRVPVSIEDGTVHPVSPSDVVGLTMLICKTMMGFMQLWKHIDKAVKAGGQSYALDMSLAESKYRRSTLITEVKVFVELFSFTMPFPEPERVNRFKVHVDAMKFIKDRSLTEWEIDMQALVLYVDDFYTVCRVASNLCKCAFGAVSLCVRPEYDSFKRMLSDSPISLFNELEKLKVASRGTASACELKQPGEFIRWLGMLSRLRKAFVNYLMARSGRLRGVVEVCRVAKAVEKDIKELESEYNAYLDSQEGTIMSFLRSWNIIGEREPLFIEGILLRDVYKACEDKFVDSVESLRKKGNTDVVALMISLMESGGTYSLQLSRSREQFWEWREEVKKDKRSINVPLDNWICEFRLNYDSDFKSRDNQYEEEELFKYMYQTIAERVDKCWFNSTLYRVVKKKVV